MHHRVFYKYDLPESIILDYRSTFISYLQRCYCAQYKVKNKISSTYHSETDGQSKFAVKQLKNYLRAYVNFVQNNQVFYLLNIQFFANNYISETTGIIPFFINYEFYPRSGAKSPGALIIYPEMEAADQIIYRTKIVYKFLRSKMAQSQELYA